jgi:hypothetical protein
VQRQAAVRLVGIYKVQDFIALLAGASAALLAVNGGVRVIAYLTPLRYVPAHLGSASPDRLLLQVHPRLVKTKYRIEKRVISRQRKESSPPSIRCPLQEMAAQRETRWKQRNRTQGQGKGTLCAESNGILKSDSESA